MKGFAFGVAWFLEKGKPVAFVEKGQTITCFTSAQSCSDMLFFQSSKWPRFTIVIFQDSTWKQLSLKQLLTPSSSNLSVIFLSSPASPWFCDELHVALLRPHKNVLLQ